MNKRFLVLSSFKYCFIFVQGNLFVPLSMFLFLSLVVGGFCCFLIGGLRQSSILLSNFANLGYDMV
ncbi:unnamed protein product [Prunus brigantina]